MSIRVDEEFRALIRPLSVEEREQLEQNILAEGCREPLVVWAEQNILLDGHNRLEICTSNEISFQTVGIELASRDDALLWIINNQLGRRNLEPIDKVPLVELRRPILERQARAREHAGVRNPTLNLAGGSGEVRAQLADEIGVSHMTYDALRTVVNDGAPELVEAVREKKVGASTAAVITELPVEKQVEIVARGREEILAAAKAIRDEQRETKRREVVEKLTSIEALEAKEIQGVYDVIVMDPPWPMQKIERDERPNQVAFDYPTMEYNELADMHVPSAGDCHLFMWTTHKYLKWALDLVDVWDFKYVCTFVWHKPGGFQPIGLPQYNCEFVVYARRGAPVFVDTKQFPTCFNAPRGAHSEKPEEFYEMIRRVTAGRRIDMFNRRRIDGFDVWGKEADDGII